MNKYEYEKNIQMITNMEYIHILDNILLIQKLSIFFSGNLTEYEY